MIQGEVIYVDDFTNKATRGRIIDKVLMGGIFDYKIFGFIRIRCYLPITYYCVIPTKSDKVIFIRAGQLKDVISHL